MRSFLDSNHKYSAQLMAAVLERDANAVLQLLQRGAKGNVICGPDGHTAVGMAAALGENEILRLLIQYCDEQPVTAQICSFDSDTFENTPESMDELEWDDEFPLDEADNLQSSTEIDEHTKLYHYYAKTLEVTGSILNGIKTGFYAKDKRKDDPNVADEALMTPLHYAAAYGQSTCVDILIESGCELNPENAEGLTPLHLGSNYYDVAIKLLKSGADPTIYSFYTFETALHMAIRHTNLQVVELLLQHSRCNIDATNSDHETPLICAIRANAEDIAMLLLDYKARINFSDKKGRTALYYAVTHNMIELANRLLSSHARRATEHYLLHHCVRLNFKKMVELLILHGESLNIRDADGVTPIIQAILCRNPEMLEILLQMSARLNGENSENEYYYLGTELSMAVDVNYHLKDFEPLLKILFAYTNTTNKKAGSGLVFQCYNCCTTPLAHALEQNKYSFAALMIKEGYDVNLAGSEQSLEQFGILCGGTDVLEFVRFLVYNGFKFKDQTMPHYSYWTSNQANYIPKILELCKNPIPLKSLARIVIRKCLTQRPFCMDDVNRSHSTEPFIFSRIKKLGLPKSLQLYLYDFPDCPMHFNEDHRKNLFYRRARSERTLTTQAL